MRTSWASEIPPEKIIALWDASHLKYWEEILTDAYPNSDQAVNYYQCLQKLFSGQKVTKKWLQGLYSALKSEGVQLLIENSKLPKSITDLWGVEVFLRLIIEEQTKNSIHSILANNTLVENQAQDEVNACTNFLQRFWIAFDEEFINLSRKWHIFATDALKAERLHVMNFRKEWLHLVSNKGTSYMISPNGFVRKLVPGNRYWADNKRHLPKPLSA